MEEVWRSVKDYEGLYEMTTMGRVRNSMTGQVLRPEKTTNGYLRITLTKNGIHKRYLVHRLVAQVFPDLVSWTEDAKGKPFEELTVNHLNEDKSDNRVENLQWCPLKYNIDYGTRNERMAKSKSKTVYQKTLDGQLVKVWPSTMECERNGFYHSAVSNCCMGIYSQYKGFKWSYILL